MRLLLTMLAVLVAPASVLASPAPIEVMILGTYHFSNPGLDLHNAKADDVLKPQRQRELQALAEALAEFRPTKVMVERVVDSPDLADPKFAEFTPAVLATERNERTQIGYRIAHRLGHTIVYGIDEQPSEGEPDYFPFGKIVDWSERNGAKGRLDALSAQGAASAKQIEDQQAVKSIAAVLAHFNTEAKAQEDQASYYELLSFGGIQEQPGADLNAMWYLRNAKIFAKLQRLAKPGDRVLVIYGMGHNYWLRHFAKTVSGYRLVEPGPYLQRAARVGASN